MANTKQLFDYLASQEEAVLTYSVSEIVLAVHSNAGYPNEPKVRSRAGGHFFLSNNSNIPPNNGAVLNIAHIIKHVMSSATEAELAALYIMVREAVYIRIILEEMGHKQPPTRCKPITRWQKETSTAQSRKIARKQWTCDSTGCMTANVSNSSESIGAQESKIMPITGPSIIRQHTTRTSDVNSSAH